MEVLFLLTLVHPSTREFFSMDMRQVVVLMVVLSAALVSVFAFTSVFTILPPLCP